MQLYSVNLNFPFHCNWADLLTVSSTLGRLVVGAAQQRNLSVIEIQHAFIEAQNLSEAQKFRLNEA